MNAELIAGVISTSLFASGNIPMLVKAARTRSLTSYSRAYLALNCVANVIHWFYVAGLPFGPIWFLHGFHTMSMALMLSWFVRYEGGHGELEPVTVGSTSSPTSRRPAFPKD